MRIFEKGRRKTKIWKINLYRKSVELYLWTHMGPKKGIHSLFYYIMTKKNKWMYEWMNTKNDFFEHSMMMWNFSIYFFFLASGDIFAFNFLPIKFLKFWHLTFQWHFFYFLVWALLWTKFTNLLSPLFFFLFSIDKIIDFESILWLNSTYVKFILSKYSLLLLFIRFIIAW